MFLDAIHSQLSTTPRNTGSNTRLARALRERLFPRSTERGPIEASGHWSRSASRSRFPRSTERGPIEARGAFIGAYYEMDVSTLYRAWPH